jgi:hypothetical protein
MIDFSSFRNAFGSPRPGSAVDLQALGLAHSAPLQAFVSQVGGGMFARGLISVVSRREQVTNLGGWERLLGPGVRLFATSAFGLLMLTAGEDVWIADTQSNDVFEADMSIEDALSNLCNPTTREDHLHESLFHEWSQNTLELENTKVLSLTPALALGGMWSRENLRETEIGIYLSFTAQLAQ